MPSFSLITIQIVISLLTGLSGPQLSHSGLSHLLVLCISPQIFRIVSLKLISSMTVSPHLFLGLPLFCSHLALATYLFRHVFITATIFEYRYMSSSVRLQYFSSVFFPPNPSDDYFTIPSKKVLLRLFVHRPLLAIIQYCRQN